MEEVTATNSRDFTCGLFHYRPPWLQRYANEKLFLFIYSLTGIVQGMTFSYLSAVLSTIEKQFGLKSGETAWVFSGNEVSQILFLFLLPAMGNVKRRPLIMGLTMLLTVLGLLVMASPHLIDEVGQVSRSGGSTQNGSQLCSIVDGNDDMSAFCEIGGGESLGRSGKLSLIVLFVGIFIVGIGGVCYYSFGLPYSDDNMTKDNGPLIIGIVWASRFLGPGLGYLLAAACLSVHVDLANVNYDESDVRWIGAWWLGFPLIGAVLLLVAPWFTLFPSSLNPPSETTSTEKTEELPSSTQPSMPNKEEKSECARKSFWTRESLEVYIRLAKRPIYLVNALSITFFTFGLVGFGTFFPKYLQIHFRVEASKAGSLGGLAKTASAVMGCLTSGIFMKRFKPSAQKCCFYNCVIGVAILCAFAFFAFLECPQLKYDLNENCSDKCNCDISKLSPVCNADDSLTHYSSPCAAGCTDILPKDVESDIRRYMNCSCLAENSLASSSPSEARPILPSASSPLSGSLTVTDGFCPDEGCQSQFRLMLGILFLITFLTGTTRVPNALTNLRAVDPRDKSASVSFLVAALSLFSFLPAPIVYGYLIDSTCILFAEDACGEERNCLIYDTDKLRVTLMGLTFIFIFLAVIADFGVFIMAKDLKFYDDESVSEESELKVKERVTEPKSS